MKKRTKILLIALISGLGISILSGCVVPVRGGGGGGGHHHDPAPAPHGGGHAPAPHHR